MQRTLPYPFLANFDAPDGTATVCQRERSNTPLQALNLLNDPVFFEAAQALALRTLQESHGTRFEDRLSHAFQLAVSRGPTAYEQERLLKYYMRQKEMLEDNPESVKQLVPATFEHVDAVENAVWVGLSRILFNMDEFITRE